MARYFRNPRVPDQPGDVDYAVLSEKPVLPKGSTELHYPYGEMSVQKGYSTPNFSQGVDGGYIISSSYRTAHPNWEDQPEELFTHHPPMLHNTFTHSSLRPHMIKLASIALSEHPGLTVDESLSKNSSRLAKKGVSMGLLKPPAGNINMSANNADDFDDDAYVIPKSDIKTYATGSTAFISAALKPHNELTSNEIVAASHQMREMVRSSRGKPQRKPHMSSQFEAVPEHPQLPGVGW